MTSCCGPTCHWLKSKWFRPGAAETAQPNPIDTDPFGWSSTHNRRSINKERSRRKSLRTVGSKIGRMRSWSDRHIDEDRLIRNRW